MKEKKFKAYHKIGQYRQVVRQVKTHSEFVKLDENKDAVYDSTKTKPTITFTGTVKTHGTNASVGYKDGEVYFQKRTAIITPENDNAGFAFFANTRKDLFLDLFKSIIDLGGASKDDNIVIYGEWIGKGIQKGVAVSELSKRFIVYDIKVEDEWLPKIYFSIFTDIENAENIWSVYDFGTYSIEIDFEKPEDSQKALIEMTEAVEKECPVGKFFGVGGIGEGIVFKADTEKFGRLILKSKGEKHSATKVKTLSKIDTEKMNSVREFVSYSVTTNRLEQGFDVLFTQNKIDPTRKETGDFLRWLVNDIITEESDTLKDNDLEPKDVNREVSTVGRKWFFDKVDLV